MRTVSHRGQRHDVAVLQIGQAWYWVLRHSIEANSGRLFFSPRTFASNCFRFFSCWKTIKPRSASASCVTGWISSLCSAACSMNSKFFQANEANPRGSFLVIIDIIVTFNAACFSRPAKSGTLIKGACFTRHLPFARDARSATVPGYSHSPLAGAEA